MRTVARLLLGAAAATGGAVLLLVLAQRRLLYFPERLGADAAARAAAARGLSPWTGGAGAAIGWRGPAPAGAPSGATPAVVLHGNAGSALDRTYLRDVLQAPGVPPLDVLLLEYPGYGARPGAPSQRALVAAAVEAIDLAAREAGRPVLLVGESLGSAVAALAAAERPHAVKGVLLVTPLASVPAVARRHYPWLPAALVRDRYDAGPALARFGGRVAFLVAGRDEVVFADLGRALHEAYPGPKRLAIQERAGHNGLDYDPRLGVWRELVSFLLSP